MDRPRSASPPPDQACQDIENKIERLAELVRRMLIAVRVSDSMANLTPTQLAILTILNDSPQRIGTIANTIGAAQNTVSEVVARLDRVGMVRKDRDSSDQRAVIVALTERGLHALNRQRAAMQSAHRSILQALTSEDRERFVNTFELLVETTERARQSLTQSPQ